MKYWKCLVIQVVWGVESRVGGKRASWNQGARASSPWVQGSSPAPRRARAWPASCPRRSLQGRELSWTERTLTLPSPRLWSPLSSRLVPTWGKPNGLFDGKLKGLSTLKSMLLEIRRSWYLPHQATVDLRLCKVLYLWRMWLRLGWKNMLVGGWSSVLLTDLQGAHLFSTLLVDNNGLYSAQLDSAIRSSSFTYINLHSAF